jgi:hypothetical protein
MVAEHWLRRVNPLAYFSVETRPEGIALNFHDLMVDSNLAAGAMTEYVYQIKSHRDTSEEKTTRDPLVLVDRKTLGDEPVAITIRTIRDGTNRDPVTVYLIPQPNEKFVIGRISRG